MSSPKLQNATFRQWMAVVGAVVGAFMAILDISITNASLLDIEGALSAAVDEGSWISTSYLIAEIVVIPLTGWLSTVFSIRRYLIVNSVLFLVFSMLCGLSWNLQSMIFFRFFQGMTGGVLIPMAVATVISVLPNHQRPIGLALFGVVATFAPALGPTIGGWLTVNYGWQYIFYLNLAPGIIFIAIIAYALDAQPMKLEKLRDGDWWGIFFMAAGLASLTVVLEEGNRNDWFGTSWIAWLTLVSISSLAIFVYIELKRKNPFINLRLLGHRNFGLSVILSLGLGLGLYGSIYILPLYLGEIQHYDALQIGSVMMWVGLPQLLIIPFVPKIMQKVDIRLLTGLGIFIFAASCFLNAFSSFDTAGDQLKWTQILRALGQPLIMTPMQSIAYGGILAQDVGSASGIFNMMRNLGGSVGIGILSTMLTRRYQFHFSRIAESIPSVSYEAQQRISGLTQSFISKGFRPDIAHKQALGVIYGKITREANIMAFNDGFLFIAVSLTIAALSLFFVSKVKASGETPAGH
jgi:DHA2 family multidrug resistance protein